VKTILGERSLNVCRSPNDSNVSGASGRRTSWLIAPLRPSGVSSPLAWSSHQIADSA
jgi:hypothetical protein